MKNFTLLFLFIISSSLIAQTQFGSDIDGEAANDWSGQAVSLSNDGTIVAIGARKNDGNGNNSGHVRVYEYSSGSWSQLGADIDAEAANDFSGYSVSLSGDGTIVAIGAPGNDGIGTSAGHVRVYEYSSGSWSQLGADIDGEAVQDGSGASVSLSDDGAIVAISAQYNDGNGNNSGHVRVYEYSSGSWSQLGADIDGEAANDWSGQAVSLSNDGTIVAIGARKNGGNGNNSGHVRVYEYSSGSWSQLGTDIDGEAAFDNSGVSISLSSDGTIVAIGAYTNGGNGSNAGHVRIYEYSSSAWTQLGSDIDGEAAGDHSGSTVSLSDDGTTVAIGAVGNGGNGLNAGHVRIYEYSSSAWTQLGSDIDGEAAGDYSGAVSLSSNGAIVAIGAYNNDGNGTSSGHVRVYYGSFVPTYSNGSGSFCSGDTIQVSVLNLAGHSYLWNTGDTTNSIDVYQGGNYSVIISNAGVAIDSANTIANEIPLPATQIAGSPSTNHSTIETYATSQNTGNSYDWYVSGGALVSGQGTNVISVLWSTGASGVVAVTESLDSSSGGCSASDTLNVSISGVGIEEVNSLSSIFLKPNPNNGHFSLEVVDQRHIGSTYRIVDGLGRTIETGTITKPSQDFDLSDKPKGVYRIQVSNEKASKTLNVVIQ